MTGWQRCTVFRVPALAYMILIFHLSSGPITSPTLNSFPDYLLHSAGYSVLYILIFLAFHEGLLPRPGRGGYWAPLILTVLYGISDEYHQSFVPSRDASVHDVISDTVGGLIGIVLVILMARVFLRDSSRSSSVKGESGVTNRSV